jgi:hypothetical protein
MSKANTKEYREIVALVSKQPIDHQKLLELDSFLRERDIEYYFFDLNWHCIEECQRLIRAQGPSYVLSLVRLQEAVLPKTDTSDEKVFDLLVGTLRCKLMDLAPSQGLTLIDNYVFTPNIRDKRGYLEMFEDIFGPVVGGIKQVRFVTSPDHYDSLLYQDVARLLRSLNPQLLVECSTTRDFHDRFWIADETKGLFIGTSLNGIGKRYALVDNMSDEDTKAIVGELRKLGLI